MAVLLQLAGESATEGLVGIWCVKSRTSPPNMRRLAPLLAKLACPMKEVSNAMDAKRAYSRSEEQISPWIGLFPERVYMVHRGSAENDLWMSIYYNGTSWRRSDGTLGDERIPDQKSKAGPALAAFDNTLHLVHLGTGWSNDIWYSRSLGGNWSVNEKLFPIQKSHVSPALVAGRQRLHMVHLGSTSRDIWHSRFDPSYVYPTCDIWADAPTVVGDFPGEDRRIIATGHRTCQGTDPQPLPIRVRIREDRTRWWTEPWRNLIRPWIKTFPSDMNAQAQVTRRCLLK